MTGMILPQDIFSNVKIDNGKVISDGTTESIVIGFGYAGPAGKPGIKFRFP